MSAAIRPHAMRLSASFGSRTMTLRHASISSSRSASVKKGGDCSPPVIASRVMGIALRERFKVGIQRLVSRDRHDFSIVKLLAEERMHGILKESGSSGRPAVVQATDIPHFLHSTT